MQIAISISLFCLITIAIIVFCISAGNKWSKLDPSLDVSSQNMTSADCAGSGMQEKMKKNAEEIGQLRARNANLESQLAENAKQLEAIQQEIQKNATRNETKDIGTLIGTFRMEFNKMIDQCIPAGNKWSKWHSSLDVFGQTVTREYGDYSDYVTLLAEQPFFVPNATSNCIISYFEVKIVQRSAYSSIMVGLAGSEFSLHELVGHDRNSFGINSRDGIWIEGKKDQWNSGFDTGDVVGCGMYMSPGTSVCKLFFTKNGALFGKPIQLSTAVQGTEFFPAISMRQYRSKIEAIFDKNGFKYDLLKHFFTY